MATYTADEDVFLTILLHAAKYPSCSVNGLLLGSKAGQGFHITAVMPLFHSASLTLAPCVETGLAQGEQLAKQRGLQLLGYYHSDAWFDCTELAPVGKRIADRIADRQPGACAVVLDNHRLADFVASGEASPFDLYHREGGSNSGGAGARGGSWKKPAAGSGYSLALGSSSSWGALQRRFLNLHASGLHHRLSDFDEHMDSLDCDYTNAELLGAHTKVLTR